MKNIIIALVLALLLGAGFYYMKSNSHHSEGGSHTHDDGSSHTH